MAKKNVVEITCDRCDRTEYVDPDTYNVRPDLELYFGPKEATPPSDDKEDLSHLCTVEIGAYFNDLCSSCRKTVKNLTEQIAKKISWKRNKGGEDELEDKKEEGTQQDPLPNRRIG